jgi:mannose/fructose/N-acetylgalactosamine-specific phosphotransferase system component IIC
VSASIPLVLAWGTLVGLDLVTVSQTMIARPLVAGSVAGVILGDPLSGGIVGTVLELFALDMLPVGASEYPDYGLGAVAGAATVAGAPDVLGIGIAILVALSIAALGGVSMQVVRRLNAADVRTHETAIDRGDPRTVAAVQYRGVARDAARACLVTAIGLLVAAVARLPLFTLGSAVLMTVVAVGASLAAALSGGLRLSGGGLELRWFVVGLLAGTAWIALA